MPGPNLTVHPNQPLRVVAQSGLCLREDVFYTNAAGKEKRGTRERATQVLERLGDVLRKALEPDEVILYSARAQVLPSGIEQFFLGLHIYGMPNTVLVLTNRRLLSLRTRQKGFGNWAWDRGLRVARWGDVAEAKTKGRLNRILELKFRNGQKESYWRIRRSDARKIRYVLEVLLPGSAAESTPAQEGVSLCPDCLAVLAPQVYECRQCGLVFKDEKTLIRRGLLLPGGSCFYAGLASLGVLHMLAEAFLLFFLVMFVVEAFSSGKPAGFASGEAAGARPDVIATIVLVCFLLLLEKGISIFVCRRCIRDFIPAN